MNRNRLILMVIGGFILVIVILSVIVMILNVIETNNVRQAYGETIAGACQPVPAGTVSEDNLGDDATPRQAILLVANAQRRHRWHSDMPEQWQAQSEDDVSLIGCVEESDETLETCEYFRVDDTDGGDGFTIRIRRQQNQARIVLLNAATGRLIAEEIVRGTEPDECPADDDVTSSGEQAGSEPVWADFADWIERYAFDD